MKIGPSKFSGEIGVERPSGGSSVLKPALFYKPLVFSENHLYINTNHFRPEAQFTDHRKWGN